MLDMVIIPYCSGIDLVQTGTLVGQGLLNSLAIHLLDLRHETNGRVEYKALIFLMATLLYKYRTRYDEFSDYVDRMDDAQ